MKNIEAVFGGILALVVLGAAIFMVAGNSWNNPRPLPGSGSDYPYGQGAIVDASAGDIECQCFDQGFALAGKDVGVMSSQYRTGFESCRAIGEARGGDAWTAGWNSRLSAKPFQASCRAWKNGRGA